MSDDLVERLRPKSDTGRPLGNLLHEAADEIELLAARITELEAEVEALRASREFWSASWSDEHTAHVLTSKRITEQLEAEIEALRAVVRVTCADRWVDFTEDGIRWAGFVSETGATEWVGEAEADAVRRALEGDDRE